MYADGKTEVDAYTPTDRCASAGVLAKGTLWHRPQDMTGVGVNYGWISSAHAQYLRMGGIDGFIGDGYITAAAEGTLDVFYSLNIHKSYWLAGDYQRVVNPGFNSDRGPVDIFNIKIHGEFYSHPRTQNTSSPAKTVTPNRTSSRPKRRTASSSVAQWRDPCISLLPLLSP